MMNEGLSRWRTRGSFVVVEDNTAHLGNSAPSCESGAEEQHTQGELYNNKTRSCHTVKKEAC